MRRMGIEPAMVALVCDDVDSAEMQAAIKELRLLEKARCRAKTTSRKALKAELEAERAQRSAEALAHLQDKRDRKGRGVRGPVPKRYLYGGRMLTVRELAEVLSISVAAVYRRMYDVNRGRRSFDDAFPCDTTHQ